MKKILIINGPNLNLLGNREKVFYGDTSLEKIQSLCEEHSKKKDIDCVFFQSLVCLGTANHCGTKAVRWEVDSDVKGLSNLALCRCIAAFTSHCMGDVFVKNRTIYA